MPMNKEELEFLKRSEEGARQERIDALTRDDHKILMKMASDVEEIKCLLLRNCNIKTKMEGCKSDEKSN